MNKNADIQTHTQAYAELFAHLSPDTLSTLEARLSRDVIFTDPFNRLEGKTQFIAIFAHMFAVMTEPRFIILDIATSQKAGYIKWQMTGRLKSRPAFKVNLVGMSELIFDNDGLLTHHHDHWDSAHQLLMNIPVAGFIVRRLLGLFALART